MPSESIRSAMSLAVGLADAGLLLALVIVLIGDELLLDAMLGTVSVSPPSEISSAGAAPLSLEVDNASELSDSTLPLIKLLFPVFEPLLINSFRLTQCTDVFFVPSPS